MNEPDRIVTREPAPGEPCPYCEQPMPVMRECPECGERVPVGYNCEATQVKEPPDPCGNVL